MRYKELTPSLVAYKTHENKHIAICPLLMLSACHLVTTYGWTDYAILILADRLTKHSNRVNRLSKALILLLAPFLRQDKYA
jgi:hypothetical protein